MLSVVMLSVVMLSVVMLSAMTPQSKLPGPAWIKMQKSIDAFDVANVTNAKRIKTLFYCIQNLKRSLMINGAIALSIMTLSIMTSSKT